MVEGDTIQLEGEPIQRARIIKVDYAQNILTLDSGLKWDAGMGIGLTFHGLSPDIGAFEFGSIQTTLLAPQNLRILN